MSDWLSFEDSFRDRFKRIIDADIDQTPLEQRVTKNSRAPLIVSSARDKTAQYFYRYARSRGEVNWFQVEDFRISDEFVNYFATYANNSCGVYCRNFFVDAEDALIAECIIKASLANCRNIIRVSAHSTNWCKPWHLDSLRIHLHVLEIPDWHLSVKEKDGLVAKSISGLPTWARLSKSGIEHSLPIMMQRVIHGTEYRIHVVEGSVFVHKLIKEKDDFIDYRLSNSVQVVSFYIPNDLEKDIINICKVEGSRFAGIDVIEDAGRYFLIEANPMPGYHSYEQGAKDGTPISDSLLALLLSDHHNNFELS